MLKELFKGCLGTLLDIIDLYWVFLAPLVTMAYIANWGC